MLKLLSIASTVFGLIGKSPLEVFRKLQEVRKPADFLDVLNGIFNGKKTYMSGLAIVAIGLVSYFTGHLDLMESLSLIANGTGWVGLRHAVDKLRNVTPKPPAPSEPDCDPQVQILTGKT